MFTLLCVSVEHGPSHQRKDTRLLVEGKNRLGDLGIDDKLLRKKS
jgi:hypothetical protein